MIENLTKGKDCSYEWIDITATNEVELEQVAEQYGLHEESISDCLEPAHLPKFEQFKNYTFTILRVFSEAKKNADTVQDITNKIAIFQTSKWIITVHQQPFPPLQRIIDALDSEDNEYTCAQDIYTEILNFGLQTFNDPGKDLAKSIEYFETQVFLTKRNAPLLKGMYFLKRKIDVIRRMLLLTYDIVDKTDATGKSNAYTRDVRDLYIKQRSLYDSLSDNTNHLLNIYFNISSQRTNETMRVLTIFSVFFLPLTFIVGVYGMNFQHMPELRARYGYPITMASMVVMVIVIYVWFKRKKWL